jgi:aldehyde dehydrogenase (NAD+)
MTVAAASTSVSDLLARLGLGAESSGGFAGEWLATRGKVVASVNPATGETLGTVVECSTEDYERVAAATAAAFHEWKRWPAPKRGEVVRQLGDALRRHQDDLGLLVTLEVGKIRSEGLGEVQEMIDMADFAVGLSRQLYGLAMHSERPLHRMYEQWHPLGPVGIISAFNFPVAVWAWNSMIAAVCGDSTLWKPSEQAPLTAIAVTKIAARVLADAGAPPIFNLAVGDRHAVGMPLAADSRFPLVSATGSTAWAARSAKRSPHGSAVRSSSWAATTASSSPPTPTSTWRCAPCSSPPSALPASAARRRAACCSSARSPPR